MDGKGTADKAPQAAAGFSFVRTLKVPPETVWGMWATKEGLEKWFGPEGFTSTVATLEFCEGGRFEIVMEAQDPAIIEYLKKAGLGKKSAAHGRYTKIGPPRLLAYHNIADFVPGVAPYEVPVTVELRPVKGGTKMKFTSGVMHDAGWTDQARKGWASSFDRMAAELARDR